MLSLTNKDFDDKLNLTNPLLTKGRVFIMYFAPSCGHCMALKPTVSQLANEYNGKSDVYIAGVDTPSNRDLMSKVSGSGLYTVDGVPTCVSYYNGKYYSTYGIGGNGKNPYRSAEDIKEYIGGIGTAPITYVKN